MAERTQKLRADAQDNRDRIIDAARELLTEQGLGVSMRDVARKAGVGPATLYRRFPTKRELVMEVFDDQMHACRCIVETSCADQDPSRGFARALTGLIALNTRYRGFVEAFMSSAPQDEFFAEHRKHLLAELTGLARRAQAAGSIRADVASADLILILLASRGISAFNSDQLDRAAERFAALSLSALRPE